MTQRGSGFQLGDVVQLKSGGPAMTVVAFGAADGAEVECQWFTPDAKPAKAVFPQAALGPSHDAANLANRLARQLTH